MKSPRSAAPLLALSAICLVQGGGCRSAHYAARDLPAALRAQPGVATQRIELRGLNSFGSASQQIGPTDLLEVTVLTGMEGEEAEPYPVRVQADGRVALPHIGPVQVAGLDPTAAGQRIAAAAVERAVFVQPRVNVVVAEQAANRITVLGAVAEPGVKDVPRNACDLLGAIAAAGGFTEEAGAVVEVLRYGDASLADASETAPDGGVQQVSYETSGGGVATVAAGGGTQVIDLSRPESRAAVQDPLHDRDVVVVRPREERVIHVSGLVEEPGQFVLGDDHDLRVLDAVAMAGGVTTLVADKVTVVRQVEDVAELVVIQASLSRAKSDRSENLLLQPGDLVTVDPTVATTVVDTLNTIFRVSMGIGGNFTVF